MNTIARGNTAEGRVLGALVQLGALVLVPFGEGHPYDLLIDLGGARCIRVQCKAARTRAGCIVFNARSTDHGRGRLSYAGRADLFGVYAGSTDSVYLIPIRDCPGFEVNLRLTPARNNQRKRVRYATRYAAEGWTLQSLAALSPAERSGAA